MTDSIKHLKTGTIMQSINKQKGAVSLLTGVMLIIATTLVVVSSGKTVLQETKMTANSYRTAQANAAANAAMDYAVAYFIDGGLDHHDNTDITKEADKQVDYLPDNNIPTTDSCSMPTTAAFPITIGSDATQKTYARFYFINTALYDDNFNGTADKTNPCDANNKLTASNMNAAMIVAQGWSDDCSAVRTLTQCVTVTNGSVLRGNGPKQPFISQGSIGLNGNPTIINRYTNSTIWTGEDVGISGAAMETHVRADDIAQSDLTTTELLSEVKTDNTQPMTNRNNGSATDVVGGDLFLKNKTSDEFFELFFKDLEGVDGDTAKDKIKNVADTGGQMFTSDTDITDMNGLIWLEGDGHRLSNTPVGSQTNPAIIIVNGDFDITGGPNGVIYGVVYVVGELTLHGSPIIKGSLISEQGGMGGTPTIIFNPFSSDGDGSDGMGGAAISIPGSFTTVSGSWKDW